MTANHFGAIVTMRLMVKFPLAFETERNRLLESDHIGDVGAGELSLRSTFIDGRLE